MQNSLEVAMTSPRRHFAWEENQGRKHCSHCFPIFQKWHNLPFSLSFLALADFCFRTGSQCFRLEKALASSGGALGSSGVVAGAGGVGLFTAGVARLVLFLLDRRLQNCLECKIQPALKTMRMCLPQRSTGRMILKNKKTKKLAFASLQGSRQKNCVFYGQADRKG